ncbi:hypothetical protein [Helicobacter pylori]|uniref:hypothetical protein n=1 Tax=Helicobacter pylori TaxID=210 RepID=UPI0018CFFCB9|nr:hypothetical protein [Helicobacter pylori]MBH0282365.1 hypothetical protein [Helicobacter pylori]MBH0287728.1 hypothetical protein [Helicobacter pylori]MBH0289902.1 hypothetical protein [Helicobacter pylori]
MRRKHETAINFNQLKAITQAIMLKKDAQANATHQESEPTQEANNSNLREKPSEQAFKPGLATHQEKGGSNEA